MKEEIQKALEPLIGKPFWSLGRIADLEWFCFGEERREVKSRNGQTKIVSNYALHLTCGWYITKGQKIYAASDDRYFPAGDDPFLNLENFDWNSSARNRLDEKTAALNEQIEETPLYVESVKAGEAGELEIDFSEGFALKAFPNTSFSEYWRLFVPYDESPHFVVTAEGIGKA